MIAAALACSIACACLVLAARRWRALARAAPRTTSPGAERNARGRIERCAGALLGVDAGAELVSAVLAAPSRAHAVAELNERLSEARASIESGSTVPRSAARVAVASGTLMALVEVARNLPAGQSSMVWPLVAFGVGLVASVVCGQMGRLADFRAQELRQAWNDLSRALRQQLPSEAPAAGERASPEHSDAIPDG